MTPEPSAATETAPDQTTAPAPTQSAADAPAPTGRRYVQLVLVLGAVIALGPLSIDMYLPALPNLADDLGASQAGAQVTLTGMLAGLALGQLILGPLSDAYGRRRVLLGGMVLHATMSVLCLLAPSLETLIAARAVQGFAGAALTVTAMATVRDLYSGSDAARMLSRLVLVIGVAPVLAPTLGGFILTFTSWRGIFGVLAIAAVLLAVVAGLGLDESLPPSRRRPLHLRSTIATYGYLLRDKTFVALVLTAGFMFAAIFAYVSGASFVLQNVYGLDEQTFGLVFGANAVVLVVFSQLNPVLLNRFEPLQILSVAVLIATLAGAALVGVTLTGHDSVLLLMLPLAAVMASVSLAMPNTPALALSRHGEVAGTASAMLGTVQFGVGALIAPLVGAFGEGTAVPMAAVILSVAAVGSLLTWTIVRPNERRRLAAEAA